MCVWCIVCVSGRMTVAGSNDTTLCLPFLSFFSDQTPIYPSPPPPRLSPFPSFHLIQIQLVQWVNGVLEKIDEFQKVPEKAKVRDSEHQDEEEIEGAFA